MEIEYTVLNDKLAVNRSHRIGKGTPGTLYEGMFNHTKVAVLHIYRFASDAQEDERLNARCERLKNIVHPNLLRCYDYVQFGSGVPAERNLFVALEFCNEGTLKDELTRHQQLMRSQCGLPELRVFQILFELVAGAAKLHQNGIIHGNITSQSVMLGDKGEVKLGNAWLEPSFQVKNLYKKYAYSAKEAVTVDSAPQLLVGTYSGCCDIWSCGMVIFEVLTGKQYFSEVKDGYQEEHKKLLQRQREEFRDSKFSLKGDYAPFFGQLLSVMLAYEERDRASFRDLFEYILDHRQQIKRSIQNRDKQSLPPIPRSFLVEKNNSGDPTVEDKNQTKRILVKNTIILQQNDGFQVPSLPTNRQSHKKHVPIVQSFAGVEDMFTWMEFKVNRSLRYLSVAKEVTNDCPYELDKNRRYTFAFLNLACYCSTIEEIIRTLSEDNIYYPGGVVNTKQHWGRFREVSTQMVCALQGRRKECNVYFNELSHKLLSKKYRRRQAEMYARYASIYRAVERQSLRGQLEPTFLLEPMVSKFLVEECMPLQLNSHSDKVLKSLNKWLNVAQLPNFVPDKDYKSEKVLPNPSSRFDRELTLADIRNHVSSIKSH